MLKLGTLTVVLGAIISVILLNMLCGCGTWSETAGKSLQAVHLVAVEASAKAEPAYRKKCMKVAKACSGMPCPALEACQLERRKVNAAIKAVHEAVKAMTRAIPLIEQAQEK